MATTQATAPGPSGSGTRQGATSAAAASAARHVHTLADCTSRPLASYLKALGVLRVLAEQRDPGVRGRWTPEGTFQIRTHLARKELQEFLLHHYEPTPLLSPWNKDAGFRVHHAGGRPRVQADPNKFGMFLGEPCAARFERIRQALLASQALLQRVVDAGQATFDSKGAVELSGSKNRQAKEAFLAALRSALDDEVVEVLDAVAVLTAQGFDFSASPVWCGGNDGRLEFSVLYARLLAGPVARGMRTGPLFDAASGAAHPWTAAALRAALFGEEAPAQAGDTMGLLSPLGTGGPNATVGFTTDKSSANPWDFVLAAEGAALLAGAATRRYSAGSRVGSKAAVPFRVDASAAGQGALSDRELGKARAELWLPLWGRWATLAELRALFGEGRVQLGRRQAARGLDFARALATLGTDRGFDAFERYAVMERNGQSNLAVPLGTFRASFNPGVRLLDALDGWAWRVQSKATSSRPPAPASLRSAWRRYEERVFAWCQAGAQPGQGRVASHAGGVLQALGELDRALVPRRAAAGGSSPPPPPVPLLRRDWLRHARQDMAEFRIAQALASLLAWRSHKGKPDALDAMRRHIVPVQWKEKRWDWEPDSNDWVWGEGDLSGSLVRVLRRRMLLAPGWRPLAWAKEPDEWTPVPTLPGEQACSGAWLDDVAAFLEGATDDEALQRWLRALVLLDWRTAKRHEGADGKEQRRWTLPAGEAGERLLQAACPRRAPIDPLYALLRLCLSGGALRDRMGRPLPPDAQLVRLAAAGRGLEASRRAARRLQAAGYEPRVGQVPASPERSRRVAAALLVPITLGGLAALADGVLGEVPALWV